MALGGGRELEDKDASVRFGSRLIGGFVFVWDKVAIGWDHHKIKLWLVELSCAWPPAEVDEFWNIRHMLEIVGKLPYHPQSRDICNPSLPKV